MREWIEEANGLAHHVMAWGPETADATVLCLHGFLDVGYGFRGIAERLAAQGRRVIAFDWRGHGETEWIGKGGYYHFMDYVADLAELVEKLAPGRLQLVAHSMGGSAACLYTGSFPERVEKLVLLEGLGPSEPPPSTGPERVARWIAQVRRVRSSSGRVLPSLEAALERMRIQNPELPDELGLELAARSTREAPGGGRIWSFDPLHRTRGPYPFTSAGFREFLAQIRCPVLCIDGEQGYRADDGEERFATLHDARREVIPAVGHMLHWFAPEAVASSIERFLG